MTSENLKKRLRSTISKQLHAPVRVELRSPQIAESVPSDAEIRVLNPHPPLGVVNVELQWIGAEGAKRYRHKAIVKGYARVAVARRPIPHGATIGPKDFELREKELSRYSLTGYFTDPNQVTGLIAHRYIRPGDVLGAGNTSKPYSIKRGQLSRVDIKRGVLKVQAQVEALENGRIGDWIRVRNPKSRKIFQAKVVSTGRLQIN